MSDTENTEQFKVGDRIKCVKERLGFPVGFETTVLEDEWILDIDGDRRPIFEHYFELVSPTRTALEQRMEDFVRSVANGGVNGGTHQQARGILAELEPVDGDLLEAREIMADLYPDTADKIRNGDWDNNAVRDCLQGLRRGRALERGE